MIGREGQIYLHDPYVSRRHAEIRLHNGRITMRDLDSGNGISIYRDGEYRPFKSAYVKEDDRVLIGSNSYSIYELISKITLEKFR